MRILREGLIYILIISQLLIQQNQFLTNIPLNLQMGNETPKNNTVGQINQKIILRLRNRDIILHYAFKMKLIISDIGVFPHGLEGLKLWDSDVILSRFCILESQRFRAKDILCLKAGVGISGIVLRKWSHCKNISMCDLRPQVISNMQNNCEKNGVRQVTTFKLNWEEIAKTSLQYDTVIASDILKSGLPPTYIIDFFKKVVRENGQAILVMPERKDQAKSFLSLVDKSEFKITNLLLTAEEYELSPLLNKVEGKNQFSEIGKCNFYAIILTKLPKKRLNQRILQKIETKNEHSITEQNISNNKKQIKIQDAIKKQIQQQKQEQQKLPNVEIVINDKKQEQIESKNGTQEVFTSQQQQLQNNQNLKIEPETKQIQKNENQIKSQLQQHSQQIQDKVQDKIQYQLEEQKSQQNHKCCKENENKEEKEDVNELNQIQQTKQQQI